MTLLSERINHLLAHYSHTEPFVSRVRAPCQVPVTRCISPPNEPNCICPRPLPKIPEPRCICGQCRTKPSPAEVIHCARNFDAYTSQTKWPPRVTCPHPVVDSLPRQSCSRVYRAKPRPRTSSSLPKVCCPRPSSPSPRSPSRRCPNTQPKSRSASRRYTSPGAECVCGKESRNFRTRWRNEGVSRSTQCPSVCSYRESTYASRQRKSCCPSPTRVIRARPTPSPCRQMSATSLEAARKATRSRRSPRRQQRCTSRPQRDTYCACVPPSWCGICARKEVERILANVSKECCNYSTPSSSEEADCCLKTKRRQRRHSESLTTSPPPCLSNSYQIGLMKALAYRPNNPERSRRCPTKCRVTFCH